ncbi:MAG: tandem-95 repeat protein, partial [Candidatus Thermoplasmatota archaeon]|nr:tandem-95 repeat protein [Candidatus Thermoplasmatota archaeon]
PYVEDMSVGQGHHDEIVFNNELWIIEGSGDFHTLHSATPINPASFSTPLQVGTHTGGLCHFFIDNTELYLALGSGGTYYIYIYNDTAVQWDLVDEKTISGYYDPSLFKVGSEYVFVAAPYTGGRQWIVGWADSHLDNRFFDGAEKAIIDGQYGSNVWVDMWPIGYTDDNGDTYLLISSERNPSDPTSEIDGNIWYIKYDWNPYHDHYSYIQEAINAATGTTISVAAGTYNEQVRFNKNVTVTSSTGRYATGGVVIDPDGTEFDGPRAGIDWVRSAVTFETGSSGASLIGIIIQNSAASDNIPNSGIEVIDGGIDNVLIRNVNVDDVSGNGFGSYHPDYTWPSPSGWTIEDCDFSTDASGSYSGMKPENMDDLTIKECNIGPTNYGGILLVQANDALVYNNKVHDTVRAGIQVDAYCTGTIDILENEIWNANSGNLPDYSDVRLYSTQVNPHGRTPATITIQGNTFRDGYTGIYVKSGDLSTRNGVFVRQNNFLRHLNYGALNDGTGTLNASFNWWGDFSGPYHPTSNPTGSGDSVSDNVDYYPFIDNDPPWTVTIEFKKQGSPAVWDTALFGEKIDALDGKDGYDIPKPGLPPHPYINGWFNAGLIDPYSRLWYDYRRFPNENKTFDLYVQANTQLPYIATTDVVISWNTNEINTSEYDYVGLYDNADTFIIDMKTHSSYTLLGAIDDTPYHFKIKCQVNRAPIAVDDYILVAEGATISILTNAETSVLTNDTDADGNSLTATLIEDVSHGTLTLNSDGTFSYTHDGSETTTDSFIYQADDGIHHSDNATVHISITPVNDPPEAQDDSDSTPEDTLISIDVLTNDIDAEDGIPTLHDITIVPSHGIAMINAGKIDYTPSENWSGIDTFTYEVIDTDLATDTAIVTITVTAVNDPPDARDDYATVLENSTANQINVLTNDTDVDNDPLRVTGTTDGSHGSVTNDDSYVYYTPNINYNGSDSFTYTVTDDNGSSVIATVNVEILNLHIISLQTSWNLIAIPFYTTFDKTDIKVINNSIEYSWDDAVNQGIIITIVYEWDRLTQNYNFVTTLEPGQGYWMWSYYNNVKLIMPSNTIGTGHITDTNLSWNIIGLPYNIVLAKTSITVQYNNNDYTWAQAVANNYILDFIYGWDRISQNYVLINTLEPGQGYWMYTFYDQITLKK